MPPNPKKQSNPDLPEGAQRTMGIDDGPSGGQFGGGGPDVPLPPYAPNPGWSDHKPAPPYPGTYSYQIRLNSPASLGHLRPPVIAGI